MQRKVIIDTDPGMDDSVALILALKSKELDIKALTTIAGNYPIEITTNNALKTLEMMKRTDIPVYRGSAKPLNGSLPSDPFTHGEDGQGENNLPDPEIKEQAMSASEAIYNIVSENENDITIITLGPLTNIAQAIIDYPDIKNKITAIIALAGTFGLNKYSAVNATGDNPHSEWNVYVDPEAAKIVIESGIEVTCIGLDVSTHFDVNFSEGDLNKLKNSDKQEAQFISQAIDFTMNRGFEAYTVLIDSMAIAYAIDDSLIETIEGHVAVETKGEFTTGMTLLDLRHHHVWDELPIVKVANEAKYKEFNQLVLDRILS